MTYKTSNIRYSIVPETVVGTTPATPAFLVVEHRPDAEMQSTSEWIEGDIVRSNMSSTGGQKAVRSATGTLPTYLKDNATNRALLAAGLGAVWGTTGEDAGKLRAGGATKSFTVEQQYGPALYRRFTGCMVNSIEIATSYTEALTLSFGISGLAAANASTAITGATYAVPATEVFKTGRNVTVTIGAMTGLKVTALSVSIAADKTAVGALGSDSAVAMGEAARKITGSVSFLLEDIAHLNVTDALTSLVFSTGDFTFSLLVNFHEVATGEENSLGLVTYEFDGEFSTTNGSDVLIEEI